MSITLNAFRNYRCGKEEDGTEFLEYLETNNVDLCASTWVKYIYPILEMASTYAGCCIKINAYDIYDSVELAKAKKLELVNPKIFTIALEKVRDELFWKKDDVSKEMIYYIDEILLPRTRWGLYLTQDVN